jgi:hypothetical protein
MNVLGGVANEQGRSLSQLIHDASGRADMTIGGVDLADMNMTPQYDGCYKGIQSDVSISMMP